MCVHTRVHAHTCVHAHTHAQVCKCVQKSEVKLRYCFPSALPLFKTDLFTNLALNRLGLLVCELQRPTPLQPNPGTRIKNIYHQASPFICVLRVKLESSGLYSKHLINQAIMPSTSSVLEEGNTWTGYASTVTKYFHCIYKALGLSPSTENKIKKKKDRYHSSCL